MLIFLFIFILFTFRSIR